MAKSATGKWVSRVGASGGGKSYKKSRPGNYYGILAVIVILGLVATVFARYEYQHPAAAKLATPPAIGTTWYAGLTLQACGQQLAPLHIDPTYKGGFTVAAHNVIRISPVSAADAGNNATLSQFAAEYPGLIASSNELALPTGTGTANPATTFKNGQTCPAASKYAGAKGHVEYAYWSSFGQKRPTVTTDPAKIKFTQFLRVAMAFEPSGVTPRAPGQATIDAMVKSVQGTSSTPATPTAPTTVTKKPATTATSTPSKTAPAKSPPTTTAKG